MNPNNWFTVCFFCAIATIISVSYGLLVKYQKLPFNSVMAFNDTQWQLTKVWVNIALLLGIILPVVMSIVFWDRSLLRQFFSCYLLAVAIQLACEIRLSSRIVD